MTHKIIDWLTRNGSSDADFAGSIALWQMNRAAEIEKELSSTHEPQETVVHENTTSDFCILEKQSS
jgi:hypothetical protein